MDRFFELDPGSSSGEEPVELPDVGVSGFEYLAKHKVLVCKEHRYAVHDLRSHLLLHHFLPRATRDAILHEFADVELVRPQDAALPAPHEPPIDCLQPPRVAFLCADGACRLLSVSRKAMAQHCNDRHRRLATLDDERQCWTSVQVQSFSHTPGRVKWFIVGRDDEDDEIPPAEVPPDQQAARASILRQFAELEAKRKEEVHILDGQIVKSDHTGWWKKTGWAEHLDGVNKKHLAHAARLPDKDETLLRRVAEVIDDMIEHCVAGLMTLPPELRRWLRSVKQAEVDPRPMGRLQNAGSQATYTRYWKRLICYALRVLRSDEHAQATLSDLARDPMADARRLFPWKEGQKDSAWRLLDSLETDSADEQLKAMLSFSATFVFDKVYGKPFNSPTVHFLAVLGIDGKNDRMRTGNDYSYMLAGLVYCARVIAVETLLPSELRDSQGEPEFDAFLEQRRRYLADGSMSAMSTMVSLLAYGKYLAMNHANPGSIFWEKEDRVMKLHGQRIAMDDFRSMIHTAAREAEGLLWTELMWTKVASRRFHVDLAALHDDVTFQKLGGSFVTNAQNKLQQRWKTVTLERMFASPEGRKMHQDGAWHSRRVGQYLRSVDRFRVLLLFLCHTTAGQPARGTEVLSLRYQNAEFQDRNIFIHDGQVMTVTRYHKSQSQWDIPKVIPRFLPWQVGQLMVLYLIYVRPLAEEVSVLVGHGSGWSSFVWAKGDEPWDTEKLTGVLKQRTSASLKVELGTLDYRHTAVAIGRKYVGDEFATGFRAEIDDIEEPEAETEDPLDVSAGRGSASGARRYGVRSDIVKHLSQRNIDTFRPLSASWHRFLGLASTKEAGALTAAETPKRTAAQASLSTPASKRPRTTVTMGLATPAPSSGIRPPPRGGPDREARPDSIPSSVVVPSTPTHSLHRPPMDVPQSSPPLMGGFGPDEKLRAVNQALGQVEGSPVSYRSAEQGLALERIFDGTDATLVIVLATGGGKTLLFTAPACLDGPGMTIVVVPYRQLIRDTVDDARGVGIDCIEWTYGVEDPAALVVVSADQLSDAFFDYASRMASKGLVRRVFVDECHLAVTAHSWRPKMARLSQLRMIEVPLVMLTATLPVWMEADLEATMSSSLSAAWIRASTARRNTKYVVRADVADGRLMDEAVHVGRKLQGRLRPGQKMVMYCRSTRECDELADKLGCGVFYASSRDNAVTLAHWKEHGGCIAATTALGTGVNYPGVVLVVHVGMPYGLIDFTQESGRAGRGGEEVDSLILVEKGWIGKETARREYRRKEWSRDEKAMLEFLTTRGCRRLILAAYFDGDHGVDCATGEMARCDRCGSGVTDWQRSQQMAATEKGVVQEALDDMAGNCAVCWVLGAIGASRDWLHDDQACRSRGAVHTDEDTVVDVSERACDEFRGKIRYLDGSKTCHRCGISQKMCRTRTDSTAPCQWPQVAIPVVRLATTSTIGRNIIRQAGYEGEMSDWDAYALWLGQPHRLRLWDELVSNSMMVIKDFLVYCSQQTRDGVGEEVEEIEETEETKEIVKEVHIKKAAAGSHDVEEIENVDGLGLAQVEAEESVVPRPARRMGPVADVAEIGRLIDGWRACCVLCKARGQQGKRHNHWVQCSGNDSDKARMETAIKALRDTRFAGFSGCNFCRRPQSVCEIWERKVNAQGRVVFKMRPGSRCTYGDVLVEATAALLAVRDVEGLKEWQQKDYRLGPLKTEMGRKDRRGEVEFSGMLLYFYRWA